VIVALFAGITVVSFLLNVVSGLRYTGTSAQILFDMRLSLYRHLQRLSPRFYARTRLGEIVSRINNDIAEIQRVAAETALAWLGNVLFLIGTEMDFETTKLGSRFTFRNPNQTAACGCGESVSITPADAH